MGLPPGGPHRCGERVTGRTAHHVQSGWGRSRAGFSDRTQWVRRPYFALGSSSRRMRSDPAAISGVARKPPRSADTYEIRSPAATNTGPSSSTWRSGRSRSSLISSVRGTGVFPSKFTRLVSLALLRNPQRRRPSRPHPPTGWRGPSADALFGCWRPSADVEHRKSNPDRRTGPEHRRPLGGFDALHGAWGASHGAIGTTRPLTLMDPGEKPPGAVLVEVEPVVCRCDVVYEVGVQPTLEIRSVVVAFR